MYQENTDGTISNLYNYKVNNKTFKDIEVYFKVEEVPASIKIIGKTDINVTKETSSQGTMFIYINPKDLHKRSTKIKIGVYNKNGELLETVKTSFLSTAQ
jgi:hypothetical protein